MSGHWHVARVRPGDVSMESDTEIRAWLAGFDIDGTDCLDGILITAVAKPGAPGEADYFLHVSLMVGDNGSPTIDLQTNTVVTTPKMVPLGTDRPDFPWLAEAVATQVARKAETATFQSNADGTVTVLAAPSRTRTSLEFIRAADPDKLGIDGAHLNVGKLADGRDVVYRVTGWDDEENTLTLRRTEPEDDPEPSDLAWSATATDGLQLAAAADDVACGPE